MEESKILGLEVAGIVAASQLDLEEDQDLLGEYTLERTKEDRRRQCIDFVYGQLPTRIKMTMEEVKRILDQDA